MRITVQIKKTSNTTSELSASADNELNEVKELSDYAGFCACLDEHVNQLGTYQIEYTDSESNNLVGNSNNRHLQNSNAIGTSVVSSAQSVTILHGDVVGMTGEGLLCQWARTHVIQHGLSSTSMPYIRFLNQVTKYPRLAACFSFDAATKNSVAGYGIMARFGAPEVFRIIYAAICHLVSTVFYLESAEKIVLTRHQQKVVHTTLALPSSPLAAIRGIVDGDFQHQTTFREALFAELAACFHAAANVGMVYSKLDSLFGARLPAWSNIFIFVWALTFAGANYAIGKNKAPHAIRLLTETVTDQSSDVRLLVQRFVSAIEAFESLIEKQLNADKLRSQLIEGLQAKNEQGLTGKHLIKAWLVVIEKQIAEQEKLFDDNMFKVFVGNKSAGVFITNYGTQSLQPASALQKKPLEVYHSLRSGGQYTAFIITILYISIICLLPNVIGIESLLQYFLPQMIAYPLAGTVGIVAPVGLNVEALSTIFHAADQNAIVVKQGRQSVSPSAWWLGFLLAMLTAAPVEYAFSAYGASTDKQDWRGMADMIKQVCLFTFFIAMSFLVIVATKGLPMARKLETVGNRFWHALPWRSKNTTVMPPTKNNIEASYYAQQIDAYAKALAGELKKWNGLLKTAPIDDRASLKEKYNTVSINNKIAQQTGLKEKFDCIRSFYEAVRTDVCELTHAKITTQEFNRQHVTSLRNCSFS